MAANAHYLIHPIVRHTNTIKWIKIFRCSRQYREQCWYINIRITYVSRMKIRLQTYCGQERAFSNGSLQHSQMPSVIFQPNMNYCGISAFSYVNALVFELFADIVFWPIRWRHKNNNTRISIVNKWNNIWMHSCIRNSNPHGTSSIEWRWTKQWIKHSRTTIIIIIW